MIKNKPTQKKRDQIGAKTKRLEIIIVGLGGDGVIFASDILGFSATLDRKYSSTRSTYSASQRGDSVFSEIIISEQPVGYPFVEEPGHIIILNEAGFENYIDKLDLIQIGNEKKIYLYLEPNTNIKSMLAQKVPDHKDKFTLVNIELMRILNDFPEAIKTRNLIMLGGFIEFTNLISKYNIERCIELKSPNSSLNQNLKAIKLGYQYINKE